MQELSSTISSAERSMCLGAVGVDSHTGAFYVAPKGEGNEIAVYPQARVFQGAEGYESKTETEEVTPHVKGSRSAASSRGSPTYLRPALLGETSSGRQVFGTDTFHEPDCLRFCPSNSTTDVEISANGKIESYSCQDSRPRLRKDSCSKCARTRASVTGSTTGK